MRLKHQQRPIQTRISPVRSPLLIRTGLQTGLNPTLRTRERPLQPSIVQSVQFARSMRRREPQLETHWRRTSSSLSKRIRFDGDGNFAVSRCKAAPVSRHGLSITDLSRLALAFASVPRRPKRYGGRRRGSGTTNPRPKPQEPQQGELLTQDQGKDS